MFAARCNYCHHPASATQVDLTHPFDPERGIVGRPTTWSGAAGQPMVDPGHPENSFLLMKLRGPAAAYGLQMPAYSPPLTDAQIDTIEAWIASGALPDTAAAP